MNDTERQIQSITASRDALRQNNRALAKENARLHGIVRRQCCDAATVVRYMAEKMGFANTAIIDQVCENFEAIADGRDLPHAISIPFDIPVGDGPADTEMICEGASSDIQDAYDIAGILRMEGNSAFSRKNGRSIKVSDVARTITRVADAAMRSRDSLLQDVKKDVGFQTLPPRPAADKHFRDMTIEELHDHLSTVSWMALDLAQHLDFTRQVLRRDLRAVAYARAEGMARDLAFYPLLPRADKALDIVVFGSTGLTRPDA